MTTNHAMKTLWGVGRMRVSGVELPYAMTRRDYEADTDWAFEQFARLGLEKKKIVLTIGPHAQWTHLAPWENAITRYGSAHAYADSSIYDAARTEMFIRRLDIDIVLGISASTLDGLEASGHKLEQVFAKPRVLVAHADAYQRLVSAGLKPWKLFELGPLWALGSPEQNGALYNTAEWLVESIKGSLFVTSLMKRGCPLVRVPLGMKGEIEVVDGVRFVNIT